MFDQEKYMKSSEANKHRELFIDEFIKLNKKMFCFVKNGDKMLQKEAEDYANHKLAIFNSFGEVVKREKLNDLFLFFAIQFLFLWLLYNHLVYCK